jgi:hypothetical protein
MSQFKVGDRVQRIWGTYGGMRRGDISVVEVCYFHQLTLEGYIGKHNSDNFKLAGKEVEEVKYKYPPISHPDVDALKEGFKGARIQFSEDGINWRTIPMPVLTNKITYRVDPDCIVTEDTPLQRQINELKLQALEANKAFEDKIAKLEATYKESNL